MGNKSNQVRRQLVRQLKKYSDSSFFSHLHQGLLQPGTFCHVRLGEQDAEPVCATTGRASSVRHQPHTDSFIATHRPSLYLVVVTTMS